MHLSAGVRETCTAKSEGKMFRLHSQPCRCRTGEEHLTPLPLTGVQRPCRLPLWNVWERPHSPNSASKGTGLVSTEMELLRRVTSATPVVVCTTLRNSALFSNLCSVPPHGQYGG